MLDKPIEDMSADEWNSFVESVTGQLLGMTETQARDFLEGSGSEIMVLATEGDCWHTSDWVRGRIRLFTTQGVVSRVGAG